jgi:hypothetical protein
MPGVDFGSGPHKVGFRRLGSGPLDRSKPSGSYRPHHTELGELEKCGDEASHIFPISEHRLDGCGRWRGA